MIIEIKREEKEERDIGISVMDESVTIMYWSTPMKEELQDGKPQYVRSSLKNLAEGGPNLSFDDWQTQEHKGK